MRLSALCASAASTASGVPGATKGAPPASSAPWGTLRTMLAAPGAPTPRASADRSSRAARACSSVSGPPTTSPPGRIAASELLIVLWACCLTVLPSGPLIRARAVTVTSLGRSGTASSTSTEPPLAGRAPITHTPAPLGTGAEDLVSSGHSIPASASAGVVRTASRVSAPGPCRRMRKRITRSARLPGAHVPESAAAARSSGGAAGSAIWTAYTPEAPRTSTPAPTADTNPAPRHHTVTAYLRSPGTDTRHRHVQ
ncbi:hypothetical protein [Streptosporangium vulgare]|uniref:hypothetical protein n=1 Tax=Streptosporangium vulgare TaxID=46190 RepID=UPI0031DE8283